MTRLALALLMIGAALNAEERFEVASLKPATSLAPGGITLIPEHGVFSCLACSPVTLLGLGFGALSADQFSFVNGAGKLSNTLLSINAKGAPCTREAMFDRIKTLLVERLGLQYSLQQEDSTIYVLTAPKYDPQKHFEGGPLDPVRTIQEEFLEFALSKQMNAIIVDKTGLPKSQLLKYVGDLTTLEASLRAQGFVFTKAGTGTKIRKVIITRLQDPSEN